MGAVFGLPDLDEGVLLLALLVCLLLFQGLQAVHPDVAMAAADADQHPIVIKYSDGVKFRALFMTGH